MNYIKTIELENYRLFKDRTAFDLAPITLLTGINSSGKSSLIKAFVLFKTSLERTKSLEELDFSGSGHNLNDFKNTLNYDTTSDIIYFKFDFQINYIGDAKLELGYKMNELNPNKGDLVSIVFFNADEERIFYGLKSRDADNGLHIKYKIDVNYFLNNLDFHRIKVKSNFGRQGLKYAFPTENKLLYENIDSNDKIYEKYLEGMDVCSKGGIIIPFEHPFADLPQNDETILSGINMLGSSIVHSAEYYLDKFGLEFKKTDYAKFFLEDFSSLIFNHSLKTFSEKFNSIFHFSSVRSIAKKIYTEREKELLQFFLKYKNESEGFNPEVKQFVFDQLTRFSIGERIEIESHKDRLIEIFIMKDGKRILLSDLGFGFTQLLPIIMSLALKANANFRNIAGESFYLGSLFLIEEPEGNLHPAYQSKLAIMFMEASTKFNVQFIIETHSEYLIRNFQFLTATKELKTDDTKIFYFFQPGTDEYIHSNFSIIQIENDGRFNNEFGAGFFDELPRLLTSLDNIGVN
ncbi:DUF3696 domain-containing protein [Aquiflexum sp.]|uniref:DUF3696 domain-containing protein n=1 Tax=Aquiflexum sp. TaxID=1872584 RepID=UPI003593D450